MSIALRTHFPGLVLIAMMLGLSSGHIAARALSTVTFDNQSGKVAVVKLIGPSSHIVEVPNRERRTVSASSGNYYILVRYKGSAPDQDTYSRGDPFIIEESSTSYSEIRITLHPVIHGNYRTRRSSQGEFESGRAD